MRACLAISPYPLSPERELMAAATTHLCCLSAIVYHARLDSHKTLLEQVLQNAPSILFGRMGHGIEPDLWGLRGFIGVVNPRKTLDLPTAGLGIHALSIPGLAYLQRRIHKDLNEVVGANHGADVMAGSPVRTHRGADHHPAMPDNLRSDKPDAVDIGVPVRFAVAQPLRELGAHRIAIQHRHLATVLEQEDGQDLGRGGLSRPAQTRQPDTNALPMPGWIRLGQNLRHFRTCEPLG